MPSIPADVHGWTAVPRSLEKFLSSANKVDTKPYSVSDIQVPSSEVAQKTLSYAKSNLPTPTFNHSMRVFYYGSALLLNHSPSNIQAEGSLIETFFLAAMLHDIGTVPENLKSTRMSFELWGAIHALKLLPEFGAPVDQAELVSEVVNRHQDLGETGAAPIVLALIYFATIFDNVGLNPEYVSKETIENVTKEYPRLKWSGCFASTIREEIGEKPWSHTTVIDRFAEQVEGNKLMEPYE